MTISATVIADSVSSQGKRLTTFQLRYPRFIHSEFMTHRMFSRNASSSRAIPVERMIADLRRDPAMPIYWGRNQPGMQAAGSLASDELQAVKRHWLSSMEKAIKHAEYMLDLGLHKQIANRILEPWAHINVVVTATEWANFFALRAHPDAQPEIKALAEAMMAAMGQSDPELMGPGRWHLPYVTREEKCGDEYDGRWETDGHIYLENLKKISVARCARVSYLTHDGRQTTIQEDLALYEKLVVSQPLHASPAEHMATPDTQSYQDDGQLGWDNPKEHGNFVGWRQLRKQLPNEFVTG